MQNQVDVFNFRQSAAVLVCALAFAAPARSADLLQIFRDARANDAAYASARAALEAGREKLPQGKALLLPTINLTGNSTYNEVDSRLRSGLTAGQWFNRPFNSNGYTLTLSQPLYRMQNWTQYEQAEFQVAQSEAVFGQASQDLILRVSQVYFDVLASQDSLATIQAQKAAIAEQLAQARRNFEVGTATITDTHEAQARFDLSTSQEIAAQNDLEFKQRALQQLIGRYPESLAKLKPKLQLSPPQPAVMETWTESAQRQNYAVRVQEAGFEIASREVKRSRAGHLPTLDVVGTYGTTSAGNSAASGIGSDQKFTTIGLQFAVPIYSGGGVNSRIREAIASQDKSRADLENSRRQAALAARQSYLGVTNGMAQVRALEQALLSSETALASNKLGYEVGVRINIDVLNSQQQVFSTQRDLSKARYDTLLNGLRLKAAAGTLSEADLEEVNRLLGSD
ncbi:MAG: TolC family outer membrane protein [Betaproteobacteria bacterium]|nr:TolC family outer membrane protein [Betaproteobacteria bacterium]